MDDSQHSNNHFLTLRASDGQAEFSQNVPSSHAVSMSISDHELTYPAGINFDDIKQGIEGSNHSNLIRIQSSSNLPMKAEMQVVASELLTSGSNQSLKMIGGQSNYIPVGSTINVNPSPITLNNIESLGSSGNLVSSISTSGIQSIPVFQSSSFDNSETVLRQTPQTNQTFLIASPGSIIPSNSIHSSEELVYLPTSGANQSYTMATSDSQLLSGIPVIQSSSTQPARIILQPNQSNTSTAHQILSNNTGPFFLQMGNNTIHTSVQNSNLSLNNKGHIIIKSGSTKVKPEPESTSGEGVLKILVREGSSTKISPNPQPVELLTNEDILRKHVQINLPSRNAKILQYDAVPSPANLSQTYQREGTTMHKLYTCPNCDQQFLKSLNLRVHKRDCKKLETKPEKTPSYMCAFCKAVFKGSSQVHNHFPSCSEHPSYGGKDKVKGGKNSEIQKKLSFPILFKCQDCDRTFSKERQYTSHLRRCSEVNFNDLSGSKMETGGEDNVDGSVDNAEDPFADPPILSSTRRGRGNTGGRRGRPPGRTAVAARNSTKTVLFEGESVSESTPGLVVLDNENMVRSTAGLAHTLNLGLDNAVSEGKTRPNAVIADSKSVKAKLKVPQAWSLVCSLCQKMFVAKEALSCHFIDQHGDDLIAARDVLLGNTQQSRILYKCPLCILNFQSEDNILEHIVLRHTGRLQDCYSDLQNQTGTFVCSLCSIVLLTKNLLIEHMSLEHLEDLLIGSKKAKANERRIKEKIPHTITVDNEDSWDGDLDTAMPGTNNICKIPLNEENPSECCFCGDCFADEQKLHHHYVHSHQMETDVDGCIIDNGIDVDIRVKDTNHLLCITGTKMTEGTPQKTVLIQKKAKKSFLAVCHTCNKNFNQQDIYYRHVQEGCIPSTSDNSRTLSAEKNFFCRYKECSNLVFNQVKSLFKHMYDAHAITVPKERKTFRNLQCFLQWLDAHSKEKALKFVIENSKIEKGSVSFSQMVCEKFHSSRANKAKEKEAELSKPTKKRLSVRTERSEDCYARIHLRTEYNSSNCLYDGETQMIYYPEHTHLKDELHETETTEEYIRKRKRNGAVSDDDGSLLSLQLDQEFLQLAKRSTPVKTLPPAYVPDVMTFTSQNGSFGFSSSPPVTTSNILMVQNEPKKSKGEFMVNPSHSSSILNPVTLPTQNPVILQSDSLPRTAVLMQSGSGNTILVHNSELSSQQIPTTGTNKSLLMDSEENSSFIVQNNIIMNMNDQVQTEPQDFTDEFVLPADEEEWTKLFRILKERLLANILTGEDKKEGESLLTYEEIIMAISVHDQANIFQRLCTITGTAIESL